LAKVRRAQQQGRWADALILGEGVARDALQPEQCQELDALLTTAGDALATLNLNEGDAFLRAGDFARAREHFQLAAAQARTPAILAAAGDRLAPHPVADPPASPLPTGCAGGHCAPSTTGQAHAALGSSLDEHTRLELLLSSYPPDLASRYAGLTGPLLEGFLLAHDGSHAQALERFADVPAAEQDDLFHFERGGARARTGDLPGAIADFELAITLNPSHLLAMETLVDLTLEREPDRAEEILHRMLADEGALLFAHGRLALLMARRGRLEEALEHASRSLAAGNDPDTIVLAASLLERQGRIEEAETVLRRLPSGGCGGQGVHVRLAELWLRQRKNLDQALTAFTSALRQDGNPVWRLRIAEVYVAKGWRKEATALLHQLLATAHLDPETTRAATVMLSSAGSEVAENSR
jgi:tetratricopeptide (TPR) repeat protein